jgi:hypothetical protein
VCPNNPAAIGAFEGQLFPAFQAILAEDVTGTFQKIPSSASDHQYA